MDLRKIFGVMTRLLMVAVAAQFFLAGRGAFTASFDAHRALGIAILVLALVTLIIGALSRAPKGALGTLSAVLGLLVLQPVLAGIGHGVGESSVETGGLLFGLHAVNGVVVMVLLARSLHRSRPAPAAASTPVAASHG